MKFYKALYERLAGKPMERIQLHAIYTNALGELQKTGIEAKVLSDAATAERWDRMTEEQRNAEKTMIAKSVGKAYAPGATPMPKNGDLAFMVQVKLNIKYLNCITLYIQGGMEGLHVSGSCKVNKSGRMEYIVLVQSGTAKELTEFKKLMAALDSAYPEFDVTVLESAGQKDGRTVKKKG